VVKRAKANMKQYKRKGQISTGSMISGKRKENQREKLCELPETGMTTPVE
jgi:hypothetical protein